MSLARALLLVWPDGTSSEMSFTNMAALPDGTMMFSLVDGDEFFVHPTMYRSMRLSKPPAVNKLVGV